jgi:DNA topoisomerase I
MAKYLVIVEAPNKTRSYAKYLGKDFHVMATVGHVIDLPPKKINIKIKHDKKANFYSFDPNYDVMEGKEAIVKQIVSEASKYQAVYLMTDPDREGEAIAWHVSKQLPAGTTIFRASTNNITQAGLDAALKNASSLDLDLVNSYETRRMVDRIVGYKCSYLTQTATGGRSVGRVQSAALRILAEREQEIKAFVPEEYWDIEAELLTKKTKKEKVKARLSKPDKMDIKNKSMADIIVADLKGSVVEIVKHDVKQVTNHAYAPFTTSTLQQAAATILSWDQKKTMNVAQKLYAAGDITYHRTDSTSISPTNLGKLRGYIQSAFAPNYLPKSANVFKTTTKNAQEAHEAVLPTDPNNLTAGADPDEKKLYKLVWERAIASQMADSISEGISVKFAYKDYELSTNGNRLLFDGWKKVWHYSLSADVLLPQMALGEKLDAIDVIAEQKFTQPPPRYSGASFVKLLDKTGIGRPSTFQSITDTLVNRDYIEIKKQVFHATDLGVKVIDFLKAANFCFIDLNFTSGMENDLDDIAEKKKQKEIVLDDFYKRLLKDIVSGQSIKGTAQVSGHKCLKCGKNLLQKHSRFGAFYACEDKENCGAICNVGENGVPVEKKQKEYGPDPCQLCKLQMVKRQSKYGVFFGCSGYPKCKGMRSEDGSPIEVKTGDKKPRKQFWKNKGKKKTDSGESET